MEMRLYLDRSNGTAVNSCILVFIKDDYRKCVVDGLPLLFSKRCHVLTQVVLMSLLRIGDEAALEEIATGCLKQPATSRWQQSLLRLTLGLITYEDLLPLAGDESLRTCQLQYYAGERFLTDGMPYYAVDMFLKCAKLQIDCDECELASWQEWKMMGRKYRIGGRPR